MMKATARLYLTASKTALVAQGDPRAATLYCIPGDEIPDSAVARFGLIGGGLGDGAPEPGAMDVEPAGADLPDAGSILRISILEGATPSDTSTTLGLDFKVGEKTTIRSGELNEAELLVLLRDPALAIEAALVGDPSPGWVPFPYQQEAIARLEADVAADIEAGREPARVLATKEAAPSPNKESAPSPDKQASPAPNKEAAPAETKQAKPAAPKSPKKPAAPKKAAAPASAEG